MKPKDFKFGRELGHGSFSTVYLAWNKATDNEVAIKVVLKSDILRKHNKEAVWMERHVLQICDHPFITKLIATMQDERHLYFVLSYAPNGELLRWLQNSPNGSFDVDTTRFYISELLLVLEYLHSKQIVHRDIKPENMLLTSTLHILLVDFGSAMDLNKSELKPVSFTGTPEFMAPEMLSGFKQIAAKRDSSSSSSSNGGETCSQRDENSELQDSGVDATLDGNKDEYKYLMDFWALGCVIYQFLTGQMPFQATSSSHRPYQNFEVFHKVVNLDYKFPDNFPDESAKDLVSRLLVADPTTRFGNPKLGGHLALKQHPFLQPINWDSGLSSLMDRTPPPLMLKLKDIMKLDSSLKSASMDSTSDAKNRSEENPEFWNRVPEEFQ